MRVRVLLNTIDKIKNFIEITNQKSYDIDLISGKRVYLDAKSLVGVLSCDCKEPVILDIHADKKDAEILVKELKEYLVA